jgi:hypothetical protein
MIKKNQRMLCKPRRIRHTVKRHFGSICQFLHKKLKIVAIMLKDMIEYADDF